MREYPVQYLWYGKHAYRDITEVMEKWPDYFLWLLERFQDVTVEQAKKFQEIYGMELPKEVIRDVEPYIRLKGDPEELYKELCDNPGLTLDEAIKKYRTGLVTK